MRNDKGVSRSFAHAFIVNLDTFVIIDLGDHVHGVLFHDTCLLLHHVLELLILIAATKNHLHVFVQ